MRCGCCEKAEGGRDTVQSDYEQKRQFRVVYSSSGIIYKKPWVFLCRLSCTIRHSRCADMMSPRITHQSSLGQVSACFWDVLSKVDLSCISSPVSHLPLNPRRFRHTQVPLSFSTSHSYVEYTLHLLTTPRTLLLLLRLFNPDPLTVGILVSDGETSDSRMFTSDYISRLYSFFTLRRRMASTHICQMTSRAKRI